jgi:hypothetical protein
MLIFKDMNPLSNQIEGVDIGMRWGQKKYCLRYRYGKLST